LIQGWNYETIADNPEEPPPATEDEALSKKCRGRCLFCSSDRKLILDPMNVPLLLKFMSSTGFILPRTRTGMCTKMQNRVARTIKHARTLNLFTYKSGGVTIQNPSYIPRDDLDLEDGDEDDDGGFGDLDEEIGEGALKEEEPLDEDDLEDEEM